MKHKEMQKIEGWLSNEVMDLLQKLCVLRPKNSDCLEIGSWKGKSAICIASKLQEPATLHCIDTFCGSKEHQNQGKIIYTYPDFLKNIKSFQLEDRIEVHRTTSLKPPELNNLGLIFIDGSHEYQDVLLDFTTWYPKLANGGYMAFHDYKWPGVKKILWEHVFSLHGISRIKRIEDTHYFKKLEQPSPLAYWMNQTRLKFYKLQQNYKKQKRRLRKKWQKIH